MSFSTQLEEAKKRDRDRIKEENRKKTEELEFYASNVREFLLKHFKNLDVDALKENIVKKTEQGTHKIVLFTMPKTKRQFGLLGKYLWKERTKSNVQTDACILNDKIHDLFQCKDISVTVSTHLQHSWMEEKLIESDFEIGLAW